MNQHDRDSAELRRLCQERDNLKATCRELRAQVQLELERHRTTWTQLEQTKREGEALRQALREIFNHVEGNTEELVRELVNWGTPKVNPNEFYDECDSIKAIASAALIHADAGGYDSRGGEING